MIPAVNRPISRADILAPDAYDRIRGDRRRAIIALKRDRRLAIGPHVTAYFECRDTMLYQVQEMLRAEKGGDDQIDGELEAYNSLIPRGDELVATVMIEIDDAVLRQKVLASLGGIETTMSLDFADQSILAVPETEVERTTADGKTSSVHFVHFRFATEQIALFRRSEPRVVFAIGHPGYGHMAVMSPSMRAALAGDFA